VDVLFEGLVVLALDLQLSLELLHQELETAISVLSLTMSGFAAGARKPEREARQARLGAV